MIFLSNKIKVKKSIFTLPFSICIFMISTGFINGGISANNLKLSLKSALKLNITAYELRKSKSVVLQKDSLIWSADGDTKLNKDRSIITLHGNAKFKCRAFSITADEVVINKKTSKVLAKNFIIIRHGNGRMTSGTFGEFSFNNK